jgi:ATP-dependent DNA ligase
MGPHTARARRDGISDQLSARSSPAAPQITLTAGGIEGVVIKDATQPYPTRAGQRIWHKLKSRRSLDMLAVGVVGDPVAPTSLVLAMKTLDDEPRAAGATAILTRAAAQRSRRCRTSPARPGKGRSSWGTTEQVELQQIKPLVVEVSADAANDRPRFRLPPRPHP